MRFHASSQEVHNGDLSFFERGSFRCEPLQAVRLKRLLHGLEELERHGQRQVPEDWARLA